MNFNIDVRKKQLQSLDQYITSSRDKVLSILSYLGWSTKEVVKTEDKITCPINHIHKIPTVKVDKHVQKCCIRTAGYQLDEPFLSEPSQDKESTVVLDTAKKIEILSAARQGNSKFLPGWNGVDSDPMTSDRLTATFSGDERLAIYEYAVKNTVPPPTPSEFDINIPGKEEKKEESLSHEELLEKERNAKRRRVKYKSVHIGRSRNYTEVIREVISNQMEQYEEYLQNTQQESNPCDKDQEESHNGNGHSETIDYSRFDIQPNVYKGDTDFSQVDKSYEADKRVSTERRSRDRDKSRDYKDKSYSHRKYKSSYDKPYERYDSYYRSRHRH